MAFSTYAAYVTALASIAVTGVSKAYTDPPRTISMAERPLSYPRIPSQERTAVTLTSVAGLKQATAELVFVINAESLDTRAVTFAEILALIDAIDTALATNAASLGIDRWTIAPDYETIGGTVYWVLVATVEASG